jgi:hypothetical protein
VEYENLVKRIDKLEYHLSLILGTLDCNKHPEECLQISFNFSENDFRALLDIFDKYDKELSKNTTSNTNEITMNLELKIRQTFNIGYQEVKDVILAFYAKHRFEELCFAYMMDHQCAEFDSITETGLKAPK